MVEEGALRPSRNHCNRYRNPAHTPTTSAMASRAPTSWKDTSSGSLPWTVASATASRSKTRMASPRTSSERSVDCSSARMSRQDRCSAESSIRTPHRTAAKPLRWTVTGASETGSGATASTAVWSTSSGTPASTSAPRSMSPLAPAEASIQIVIAWSRWSSRFRWSSLSRPPRSGPSRHPGREHARAVAVVDVDHGHAGSARVEHGQEGGEATERGAVADAGGHRHERYAGEPADDRGQRPLHARDHDQAVGLGEPVTDAEQSVESGDPDVGDLDDAGAMNPGGERGLGGDGGVRRAGRDDGHGPGRVWDRPECHRARDPVDRRARQRPGKDVHRLVAEAGGHDCSLGVLAVQGLQDADDLGR